MDILKRYGSRIAIGLMAAGLICLVLAFFIFPIITTANVWTESNDQPDSIIPDSPIAANWLLSAGIRVFPGDSLSYAGLNVQPSFIIPQRGNYEIAYRPGYRINLVKDGITYSFSSSAETIGDALWEQGVFITAGDKLSLPFNTPLDRSTDLELKTARPILVQIGNEEKQVYSAADTVGEVLQDAGIDLEGLDITKPQESEPVPGDGRIEVVRVSEETLVETSTIPYTTERVADPEMTVGQEKVLQTGQNGVMTSSVRVRYENGVEVSRKTESEWISTQPISQKTAYGTKIVVQTSPEGLNYWLTKQVRITSYHDTGNPTSSGIWPYYGVIAVSPEWYSILKGTSIYVPDYGVGTVLDVCPGCSGEDWIDVFIPTEDYVSWSRNETVYFLAPAPENFSGDLP